MGWGRDVEAAASSQVREGEGEGEGEVGEEMRRRALITDH